MRAISIKVKAKPINRGLVICDHAVTWASRPINNSTVKPFTTVKSMRVPKAEKLV